MKTKSPILSDSGNAIFLILIAVGLFAALSYAVSSSFRGGTDTLSTEQSRVSAGNLLRTMESVRQGYDYLWNQQGCSIDDISFQSTNGDIGSVTFTDKDDDGAPECEIFNPVGGGISYPNNLAQYQDASTAGNTLGKFTFWFTGNLPPTQYGIETLATTDSDHLILLTNVTSNICQAVNKTLSYDNHSSDMIDAGYLIGNDYADFEGRSAGCRARAAGGPYDVFYVMQPL